MLFAAWRNAKAMAFFPLGVLLLMIRPPLSLLLGTRRSQLANRLAEEKRLMSFRISPEYIEQVINEGTPSTSVLNGVSRTIYTSGNVRVVTEEAGKIIVTVITK
jgi:hypothetical protein